MDRPEVSDDEKPTIWEDFGDAVNMAPQELEDWLETDDSKSVGKSDGNERVGHQSGRRIVKIKRTRKDDLSHEDYRHMKKVVNYVSRHTAQRPDGDVSESNWCYSLKNWGHDPTK